uniref:Uncharacterized protein n=1 Tax=Gasterosteus aculeatus TaxID=69293 RepID=G3NAD4_GASAC
IELYRSEGLFVLGVCGVLERCLPVQCLVITDISLGEGGLFPGLLRLWIGSGIRLLNLMSLVKRRLRLSKVKG